jgi:RNA polymerase sigma-70 factor (ECF subfamily)
MTTDHGSDGVKGSSVNVACRYIRTLFETGMVAALSDGQLLGRFVDSGESASLETLVRRHGPMVWGVCRRVLRDHHEAEDAFQATFLVLARRAASIMPRDKVGNWLYGVAYQTARKARATRAKRRMREGQVPDAPEPEAGPQGARHDLAEWLDHEMSRLPAKYRIPIVLCELEGKTHAEAAQRLGWPIGTVSGRLSRAKAMLAKRLTRRGVSLTGGSLAVLLFPSQGTASAGMPAPLLSSTVKAASLFAAGQAAMACVVSSTAAALAKEVLKTMLFSKIKIIAAITTAALLALTFAGAGLRQARTWANERTGADEAFGVTVHKMTHDDSTVVTQIDIDALPRSTVEFMSDKDQRGGATLRSSANGRSHVGVRIFAKRVQARRKGSWTNRVKFGFEYKVGSITTSTSDAEPMPSGAKRIADVLKLRIKTGEYKYGQKTKLVTFKGVTYSLRVTRPKR